MLFLKSTFNDTPYCPVMTMVRVHSQPRHRLRLVMRLSAVSVPAAMARDAKPHRLELINDRGASYRLWRQRWDDYAMLAGLAGKPPALQMAILRTCLSDEALTNRTP